MTRGASIILVLTIMVPAVVLGQAYKTMSLLEAEMADMAIAHPLNATLMTLEDGAGVAIETVGKDLVDPVNDIKRRHLHSLAISSGTGTQSKKIVVIGSQHAAEWAAHRQPSHRLLQHRLARECGADHRSRRLYAYLPGRFRCGSGCHTSVTFFLSTSYPQHRPTSNFEKRPT